MNQKPGREPAESATNLRFPTYKEENICHFGRKLWFLNQVGELQYKTFLETSGFAASARRRGVKNPRQAFSKWIAGCRGKEENKHAWSWLKKDEFHALVAELYKTLPWTQTYIAASYPMLLRNPLFHALARPMKIGGEQIRRALERLCGHDAQNKPKIGYYQLYRPTLSEPVHKILESEESVVIQWGRARDSRADQPCGPAITGQPTNARTVDIRAI